ncbi:3D domain-containing protein [Marinicrinis sediminis]|uniref:3D domain-containing protein n=1 Tax=Marinicrinis sediminis TaxID=1652465 RepID=A0ABW5R8N7_9BACL
MFSRKNVLFTVVLILLCSSSYLIINQTKSHAATTVGITLSYAYESIPSSSVNGWNIVDSNAQVLYKVTVKATVSGGGYGIIGKYLTFSNPNTSSIKKIGTESSINTSYATYATYEVRGVQTFSVTASINDGTYIGSGTNNITNVLTANYQSTFYCTCYNTPDEKDFSGNRTATATGITGKYKQSFLDAVKLNGSGWSQDSTWIRYNASTSNYSFTAPTTASGTTPVKNKTIAVDRYYIPRWAPSGTWQRGTVDISGVGKRLAEDAGGAINQYDIDIYMGVGNAWKTDPICNNSNRSVTYLGNNKW